MDQRGQVCSLILIILKSVDDSNPYNFKDKGTLYITGDCKPWDKLFRPEKTVKVDKVRYVASSNPHAMQKKLPQKIFTEENFSNLASYLCYT